MTEETIRELAYFSCAQGRGVVFINGETYAIDVYNMNRPFEAGWMNLKMWMSAGPQDFVEMEPGEYPFTEVYNRMKVEFNKVQKERAVRYGVLQTLRRAVFGESLNTSAEGR